MVEIEPSIAQELPARGFELESHSKKGNIPGLTASESRASAGHHHQAFVKVPPDTCVQITSHSMALGPAVQRLSSAELRALSLDGRVTLMDVGGLCRERQRRSAGSLWTSAAPEFSD